MTTFEQTVYPDWQYEVANGDTLLGFHDWIDHNADMFVGIPR